MPACLGSARHRVRLEHPAGHHRRTGGVDLVVGDLVVIDRAAGHAVDAGPVDHVVRPGRRRSGGCAPASVGKRSPAWTVGRRVTAARDREPATRGRARDADCSAESAATAAGGRDAIARDCVSRAHDAADITLAAPGQDHSAGRPATDRGRSRAGPGRRSRRPPSAPPARRLPGVSRPCWTAVSSSSTSISSTPTPVRTTRSR